MKRDEQVTVRMVVEPKRDPDKLRWLDDWITKLLNETKPNAKEKTDE